MKAFYIAFFTLTSICFLIPSAIAEVSQVPDTGITKCYDNAGNEITCPSEGAPFYGQDAQYEGLQMSFRDNGDGTVSDLNTGLIWQQADDGIERNWADAGQYCENLTLAEKSDWRLPTKRELMWIVDYGKYGPAIDPVFECRSSYYWSGSTGADGTGSAWGVDFDDGGVNGSYKANGLYVRCVRSGPSGSFNPSPPLILSLSASEASGPSPLTVDFTPSVSGGSPPYTYTWDFGDGMSSSNEETPARLFSTPGTYTAILAVSDKSGQTTSESIIITVTSPKSPLIASVAADILSGNAPFTVTFTPEITGGTPPYTIHFDFGDGADPEIVYTATSISHIYTNPGTYTATMTVEDADGNTDSENLAISATEPTQIPLSVNTEHIFASPGETITVSAAGGSGTYFWLVNSATGGYFETPGGQAAVHTGETVLYHTPPTPGTYIIILSDASTNIEITVNTKTPVKLDLIPNNAVIVSVGATKSFMAIVTYDDGSNAVIPEIALTSDDTSIVAVSGNTATSNGVGSTTIHAVYQGLSASASVTVDTSPIEVSVDRFMLPLGESKIIEISGGVPPYSVVANQDDAFINAEITGSQLSVMGNKGGVAVLSVNDMAQQSIFINVTVTEGELTVTPANIVSNTGSTHTIIVSGGTGTYTWNTDEGILQRISRNEFLYTAPDHLGEFTANFQDSAGSVVTLGVNINSTQLAITPSIAVLRPNEATVLKAIEGTPPYTFYSEREDILHVTQKDDKAILEISELTGDFKFFVRDTFGLEAYADIKVIETLTLNPEIHYANPSETIEFEAKGGAGDYLIKVETGRISSITNQRFSYTCPDRIGTYSIQLTDALQNTTSSMVVVGNVPRVTPSYVHLDKSGTFQFNILGGFPPYTVGSDIGNIESVGQAEYQYTATDTEGIYYITAMDTKGVSWVGKQSVSAAGTFNGRKY